MDRWDAVLDASFWINAERSGVARYLLDYFRLHVPPLVMQELSILIEHTPAPPSAATLFADWLGRGDIGVRAPQREFERFDAGENQAIALAQERDWVLLIDDAAPLHYSRGPLGLKVVPSPALVVFLYEQARIDYRGAIAALQRSQAGRRMVGEAYFALELLAREKGER